MDRDRLEALLLDIKAGRVPVDEALRRLRSFPYDDLGFAKLDTHRSLRTGFSEAIFCKGKSLEQIAQIAQRLSERTGPVLATKADRDAYEAIRRVRPDAVYHELARMVVIGPPRETKSAKPILVVSAGTADFPIVEEATVTAETMGNVVERLHDVGVAGVHRLLDNRAKLDAANVIIVVAGMEGALASVVGGLVNKPVIAVPTSVGYGASFDGLAALLAMLNSCAPGVVVVNIDNGFGAGYFASMINQLAEE